MPDDIYGELDAAVANRRPGVPGVSEPVQQTRMPVFIPGTQEISHYETQEQRDRRTGITGATLEGVRGARSLPVPAPTGTPTLGPELGFSIREIERVSAARRPRVGPTRPLSAIDDPSGIGDRPPEPLSMEELFTLFGGN